MNQEKSLPPGDPGEEVSALIEVLRQAEERLAELTAGEVDTVMNRDGRAFLLQRAQEQLRHSDAARQTAILDAVPASIALLDSQGLIISANKAWRGFDAANVFHAPGHETGLNYLELCDSAQGDDTSEAHQVAEGLRGALGGGKSFSIEYPCQSPTGQHWFLLTVTPLTDDHPNGAVVMQLNITARKLLEDEVGSRTADLIASEHLYRSTFDEAPVGIVHVGLDGQWLRVNQRVSSLLGYSREELQTVPVLGLLQAEDVDSEAEALRQMVTGTLDRHVVDEKRYRRRDGTSVWARVTTLLHRDTDGQPQHFITVLEDVTERRTLEAQVRQANKMDAIGRLASGVAHDFNNLLTVILGFADFMTADAAMASQHGKDLGEIIKAAQHAARLTKQLLAFSRQQVLQTAPLDVNGLITNMTDMLDRLIGDDIEVALNLAPNLSLMLADRGQLEQVVMNLVVNARDAMPGGGSLTIKTAEVELENSTFHEEAIIPGHYVMLAITDTGGGMTKETQRRLFEPFFTTKEAGKGTGLGLSTTYGIVKQSKGHIWVYSEPGLGTTFKVYLPRSDREVPLQAFSPVVTAPVKSASETVLLVEDEAGVRRLAKRILDKAGYRVLDAGNGDDAERLFAHHAGAIDLVVTDIIMPGCGGPELLRRLLVHAPALKVLYMSGYTEQSAAQKTGIDRGLPFVQKPFTAVEFVQQVRAALDR